MKTKQIIKEYTNNFISTSELAKLLGISRVAVFKRIKNGDIPAQKVGRNYIIALDFVNELINGEDKNQISEAREKLIEEAVQKVVSEYGEALKLLGKE